MILEQVQRREDDMKHYVGLDVSLKQTSVCIVDEARTVLKEGKVPSDAEAIAVWLLACIRFR